MAKWRLNGSYSRWSVRMIPAKEDESSRQNFSPFVRYWTTFLRRTWSDRYNSSLYTLFHGLLTYLEICRGKIRLQKSNMSTFEEYFRVTT